MRTRVKICGVTRAEDAGLAAAAGADAIGFVFWPKSPRAVTVAQASAIWTTGALVARVGVFVNESPATVREIVREARLTAIQRVTLLVDAKDDEKRGGTGRPANWMLAADLARLRPIILAGGLNPANVAGAIEQVQPWAVDVSSGVEAGPGIKRPERLSALFQALRDAAQEAR